MIYSRMTKCAIMLSALSALWYIYVYVCTYADRDRETQRENIIKCNRDVV